MEDYLDKNSNIIKDKDFENAVAKIQGEKEDNLTFVEAEFVTKFLKLTNEVEIIDETPKRQFYFDELMERASKRRKSFKSGYIDCGFLTATSLSVESLFSTSKNIMSDERKKCLM